MAYEYKLPKTSSGKQSLIFPTNIYSFSAYMSSTQTGIPDASWDQVEIDTVRSNGDPSGSFNTSTHKFVVPVKGLWLFGGYIMTNSSTDSDTILSISKNGTTYQVGRHRLPSPYQSATSASGSILHTCEVGDEIDMDVYVNRTSGSTDIRGGSGVGDDASFWGFLVHRS